MPNKKLIPFQQGEETLYFLSVSIALPDTIHLQLSDSIGGRTSELSEKMIGRDELVFTVLIQRMFKRFSNHKLATEKVVFLFNQIKTFYEEYANAVDENSIPDSIQHKTNLLKQQIAKTNDSIEAKTARVRQLRIEKRFRKFNTTVGRLEKKPKQKNEDKEASSNTQQPPIEKDKKRTSLNRQQSSIDNVDLLKSQILYARVDLRKLVAYREGVVKKVIDYKSYYANPSLFLTGNALSYLEDEEPATTTGLGIYSKKSDLWEFSAYVTISQSRDLIRADFNDREVFGNAMLVPGVRKYSLLTNYRNYSLWPFSVSRAKQKLGFGWNVNVTPMNWELSGADTSITENGILTTQVIPFGTDLFLSFNWLTSKSPNRSIGKEFRVSTDFGFTFRHLFGDLSQKDPWIEQFLGVRRRFFPGIYLGINLAIDNLQIFFNGPILLGDKVEGLTFGQTIANIGLRGKLFNIGNNE
jgi:hypothetical protein